MKRVAKVLTVLVLLLLLPMDVSAHSGGTDSDGGHTDHSTGEYHYHHGYPAHQHSDMDGDGDLDCPYEFKEKKQTSSNSYTVPDINYGSFELPKIETPGTHSVSVSKTAAGKTEPVGIDGDRSESSDSGWMVISICGCVAFFVVLGFGKFDE